MTSKIHRKKSFLYIAITLFSITIFVVYNNTNSQRNLDEILEPRIIIRWKKSQDVSCHYEEEDGYLVSAEDLVFKEDSIFFHETSCKGGLNSRQACAVESTARMHGNRQVYVLFSGTISKEILEKSCLKELRALNVQFARVRLPEYAKGTDLEHILKDGINKTQWKMEHTADILRFITLYKYGGIYLDTDVIVVKSLDDLGKDWAARESSNAVNNAVMAFSENGVGHFVLEAILNEIRTNYKPYYWSYNGPGAITRVLHNQFCNGTKAINFTAQNCHGFEVYAPEYFYPVEYPAYQKYFEKIKLEDFLQMHNKTYGFHFWNRNSYGVKIENNSVIQQLAEKYCPIIFNSFGDQFGL